MHGDDDQSLSFSGSHGQPNGRLPNFSRRETKESEGERSDHLVRTPCGG